MINRLEKSSPGFNYDRYDMLHVMIVCWKNKAIDTRRKWKSSSSNSSNKVVTEERIEEQKNRRIEEEE